MKLSTFFSVIIMASLIIPRTAGAQFGVGALGGLNFGDAKIEDDQGNTIEAKGQTEFGAGVLAEFDLNEDLTLGTNILYLKKGVEATTADGLVFNVWAGYIEVPLYLKYSFGEKTRPYFFIGPSVGFLAHSEVDIEVVGLPFNGDFSTVLENMDYSIVIGAGLDIPLWKGNLLIQGRYTYGFYDILKGGTVELKAGETLREYATVNEGDKIFTRGIHLFAGYTLPLGHK